MRDYEFHVYDADASGAVSIDAAVQFLTCADDRSAKSVARRLAKASSGPVDVARKGPAPWNDRYIITAARQDLSSSRVFMERLD